MINLFPHQEEAIKKLSNGSILCGGVGSGKSITALAYYIQEVGKGYIDFHGNDNVPLLYPLDVYIITTARKRDTLEWEKDAANFKLSRDTSASRQGIKLTVDSWNNIGKYENISDAFFIFDEQRVVGAGAWVTSFYRITKKNKWLLLSATPGDTWSDYIPVFIANGFYKNRTEFIRRHIVYNRFSKFPQVERYVEERHLSDLTRKILVNMEFNRHTTQHHTYIRVDYDEILYKQVLTVRQDPETGKPFKNASGLCLYLRKIVNSDTSRIDELNKIISKHDRIIVFYNFNYELEILREWSNSTGIKTSEWNGFIHEPIPTTDQWIYLVQYTAGAEGWNCITTDTTVFYSQNYSYKIMTQAAGRIDRMNTTYFDLHYYHLYSNASIDKAILRAIKLKKNFNEKNFLRI